MPSVTTSAPTIEALTATPVAPTVVDEAARREPPPPPTIMPDIPSAMPTPRMPLPIIDAELNAAVDAGAPPIDAPTPAIDAVSPAADGTSAAPSPAPDAIDDTTSSEDAKGEAGTNAAPPALVAALDALSFTPEQKKALAAAATLETLSPEEEVSVVGLALIVDGQASAQATVSDVPAVELKPGALLYAKCSIPDTLSLRIVAEASPTIVAVWDSSAEGVLAATPDLVEQLKRSSDRTQAIAGSTMGPVGERLDEGLRAHVIEQLEVRAFAPHEVIAPVGQPVPGMVIVGVGTVELEGDGGTERLGPGEFLFATEVLGGGAAPATASAGPKGAIVLFGERAAAKELLVACPPLLEVFAGM
jgi:hypothetical protein